MIGASLKWSALSLLAVAVPATARETVRVAISCSPEGQLETIWLGAKATKRIDGQSYEQVIARDLPNKRATIRLINGTDTSYRCIGGFIYTLQRLGYRHFEFISEPPPE